MKVGERRRLEQRQAGGEFALALARKPGDDVGAERRVGQRAARSRPRRRAPGARRSSRRMRRSTPSAPACTGTCRCGQSTGAASRSGRGAAASPPADRSSSGGCAAPARVSAIISDEIGERERRREILAVAAEVDAGQHRLPRKPRAASRSSSASTRRGSTLRLRPRANGHDAEGAEEVAALLHLEERARLAGEASRRRASSPCSALRRLLHQDAPFVGRDLIVHGAQDVGQPADADHVVDFRQRGALRAGLREAAGEDHAPVSDSAGARGAPAAGSRRRRGR